MRKMFQAVALALILSATMAGHALAEDLGSQLVDAVRKGDIQGASNATGKGADVDYVDSAHRSVLSYAIEMADVDMIRLLINDGAETGDSMATAAEFGNAGILTMLYNEYGADPDGQAPDGATALIRAAGSGKAEMVRMLLDYGAGLDIADISGKTALLGAVWFSKEDCARLLADAGADVNAAMNNGFTPLMAAASSAKPDMLLLILDNGADVNLTGPEGRTALIYASLSGCGECVRRLIDHGVLADIADKQGKTALAVAKEHPKHADPNYADIIRMLTDVGAAE